MTTHYHDILFHGEIRQGFTKEEVKQNLQFNFKMTLQQVDSIFSHTSTRLKKNVLDSDVQYYRKKFDDIGMVVELKPSAANTNLHSNASSVEAIDTEEATDTTLNSSIATHQLHPFSFTGSGSEYFGIWIVNIILSIITLGIYSAWAKVRTRRYFHNHTFLMEHSFEYHANPVDILKGRSLAAVLFVIYIVLDSLMPLLGVVYFIILLFFVPWLLVRSKIFNARNVSYRNIRFNFKGTVIGVFLTLLKSFLYGLFLMLPSAYYCRDAYFIGNSTYGLHRFEYLAKVAQYRTVLIRTLFFFIAAVLVFGAFDYAVKMMIAAQNANFSYRLLIFPFMAIGFMSIRCYFKANMTNLRFNYLKISLQGFKSTLHWAALLKIYSVNFLGMLFTLGLFYPWAKVRLARYHAQQLTLESHGDMETFFAETQSQTNAIGEEVSEMFDFEFGY